MSSLIYEVVWSRPLTIVFGSTIYAWGTVLVAFILGMGLGSLVFTRLMRKVKNPITLFAYVELALGAFGLAMVPMLNSLTPLYLSLYNLFHSNFQVFIAMQGLLLIIILLLPTFLMGATFPIAVKIYAKDKESAGEASGMIYGIATIGSAIGAGLASFILIASIGVTATNFFAGIVNVILGLYLVATLTIKSKMKLFAPFLIVLIAAPLYTIGSPVLGAYYYPNAYTPDNIIKTDFSADGLYQKVSVIEFKSLVNLNEIGICKTLLVDGRSDGGTVVNDLRTNYFLAYLPLMLHPNPKTSLNIGLGTGITSGVLARYTQTTTIEIDPTMIEASSFFSQENNNVLDNSNHTLVTWDARNYLLLNDKKYDIIISEPSRTWAKSSAPLFSQEFYSLAESRLNDNGVLAQWVPIFELDTYNFEVFYHTFASVFPYTMIFANFAIGEVEGGLTINNPSELILVGFKNRPSEPIWPSEPRINDFTAIRDLKSVSTPAQGLQSLLLTNSDNLKYFATNVPVNTDGHPILEFSSSKNIVVGTDYVPQIITALTRKT
jgi:spermidine synthase